MNEYQNMDQIFAPTVSPSPDSEQPPSAIAENNTVSIGEKSYQEETVVKSEESGKQITKMITPPQVDLLDDTTTSQAGLSMKPEGTVVPDGTVVPTESEVDDLD